MTMNSIPHSAQSTRDQSHPLLGRAAEGDGMGDITMDRALADSYHANSVNLPSIDHCLPAPHVPVPPVDFDFSALRRLAFAMHALVESIAERLDSCESALFGAGPGEATPSPELHAHHAVLSKIVKVDLRHYQLAPTCQLYLECARSCGCLPDAHSGYIDLLPKAEDEHRGTDTIPPAFLEMTGAISEGLKSREHLDRLEAQHQSARRDQHAVRRFMSALIAERQQILSVRVTLAFRPAVHFSVSPEQVRAALKDLLRTARAQRQFQPMLGFVWAMRDHPLAGPQIRLLTLFNGDQVSKARVLATSLCELWDLVVTGGKGSSFAGLIQDGMATASFGSMIKSESHRSALVEFAAAMRIQPLAPLVVSGPIFGFGRIQGDLLGSSSPAKGFLTTWE